MQRHSCTFMVALNGGGFRRCGRRMQQGLDCWPGAAPPKDLGLSKHPWIILSSDRLHGSGEIPHYRAFAI